MGPILQSSAYFCSRTAELLQHHCICVAVALHIYLQCHCNSSAVLLQNIYSSFAVT